MPEVFQKLKPNEKIQHTKDNVKMSVKDDRQQPVDPLATGLADWDLLPPETVVRRARRKKMHAL